MFGIDDVALKLKGGEIPMGMSCDRAEDAVVGDAALREFGGREVVGEGDFASFGLLLYFKLGEGFAAFLLVGLFFGEDDGKAER